MSSSPPQHSLSLPTSGTLPPVLPTPSSSTSASARSSPQPRNELEQQLAEKEKQLQETRSVIEKNVFAKQIRQIQDKLKEYDHQKTNQQQAGYEAGQQRSPSLDNLPPVTMEKLRNLERDFSSHRVNPLSPGLTGLRKEKLLQRSNGLEPLPSPSSSTLLPPVHGHDSSILPLPPSLTGSTPTKRRSKVPNTDRRNTDIEFATEIGQGLLLEVRKMQALLQEKEEQLRALEIQKADLERAAESMAKQLRQREENEEKLQQETWNLELAKQELTVSVTELQQNLSKARSEQNKLSKQLNQLVSEIEHLRDREEKLTATVDMMKNRHEQDMSAIRRQSAGLQREKSDQSKQIEALTSELAIIKAQSKIAKRSDPDLRPSTSVEVSDEPNAEISNVAKEGSSPNTTPPPSPKQTPTRNQALEVETLKTSLGHAHRMVSNLRSHLHKEKTEKFELKKLLSESQETIEQFQNDPRLWVDSGNNRLTSPTEPPTRKSHKAKRRAPARKNRSMSRHHRGDDITEETSENDKRRKRKDSQLSQVETSYTYSSVYSSDSELSAESDNDQPSILPGFSSLELELSQSQSKNPSPSISTKKSTSTTRDSMARSLGDELSAAKTSSAAEDTQDVALAGNANNAPLSLGAELAVGGAIGGLLSHFSSHNVSSESIAPTLAPEPRFVEWVQSSLPAFDFSPAEVQDIAVQCVQVSTSDASVQSIEVLTKDSGVQSIPIPTTDSGVQSTIIERTDSGVQSELVLTNDSGVQSELVLTNDSGVQSEMVEAVESIDMGTQSEVFVKSVDMGVQSNISTTHDVSVQSDIEETFEYIDMGTQCAMSIESADMATQSDSLTTHDMSVQSDLLEYVDQAVQYEESQKVHTQVQCDPLPLVHQSTQCDHNEAIDCSVQSDPVSIIEPITVDAGVQYDPSMEESAVLADPKSSSVAAAIPTTEDTREVVRMDRAVQVNIMADNDNSSTKGLLASAAGGIGLGALVSKAIDSAHAMPEDQSHATKQRSTSSGYDTETTLRNLSSSDSPVSTTHKNDKPDTPIVIVEPMVYSRAESPLILSDTYMSLSEKSPAVSSDGSVSSPSYFSSPDELTDSKRLSFQEVLAPIQTKLYTKEETDAMIESAVAAAVVAALAKNQSNEDPQSDVRSLSEDTKRHTCDMSSNSIGRAGIRKGNTPSLADLAARGSSLRSSNSMRSTHDAPPPRPTSPPPASLLSRVGYAGSISTLESSSLRSSVSSREHKGKAPLYITQQDETSPQVYNSVYVEPNDIIYQGRQDLEPRREQQSLSSGMSLESLDGQRNNNNNISHSISSHSEVASQGPQAPENNSSGPIALVTDTMIGEWLWKYTRKHVGSGLSENRHKRYFWIHPYTRTLYWSTQAPGVESNVTKAKSAFIESVSTVEDSNPGVAGMPNVSLMIKTNTRLLKVTAPSMERHKVWLESLSYLLARANMDQPVAANPESEQQNPRLAVPPSVSSSGRVSLLRKRSIQQIQDLFRSGSNGSRLVAATGRSTPADHHRYDDDDEALEDVRMCCDGKHHVSKLEKDHLHRPTYRKRTSRPPATSRA
ncbi:hypothetical protein CLU79DRAFT_740428 [Phycomyces nitens]|nr:hypothetical protein CLU79DRAFT_740428 [Phycomyces nitens]